MTVLILLFLLLATICFLGAALGAAVRNINLLALGLFFWVLVPLTQALLQL